MDCFATSRKKNLKPKGTPAMQGCDRAAQREDQWYGSPSPIGKQEHAYVAHWPINRIIENLVQWHMRLRARRTRKRAVNRILSRATRFGS